MKVYPSVWGSIVALINSIRQDANLAHPTATLGFIDWESHANIHELPETDLIGPTAITFNEISPQMFEVSFAIAVSTYATDQNLFRLRDHISRIFERLRVNEQVDVRDSDTALKVGYLVITESAVLPLTRAETRPFQYVQVSARLDPAVT